MEDVIYCRCVLKTGILYLFSEYPGFLPNGYICGKPIYMKKEKYSFNPTDFKTKLLSEGEFLNLAYRRNGQAYENVSDYEMRKLARKEFEEIEVFEGIFDNLVFLKEEFISQKIFPREELKKRRKEDSKLDALAQEIESLFDIGPEDLGITGSVCLGAKHFGDYDFVFYGSVEQMLKIKRIIDGLTKEQTRRVFENGLFWRARFMFHGEIICCFFNYDAYLPQLWELYNLELDKPAQFSGIVQSQEYALSKNAYFKLKGSTFDSVILLSNMFKNAINIGDRISGKCYACTLKSGEKIAVVKNPPAALENYLQYFTL